MNTTMPAGLSSSPPPKKKANCMIIEATLAKKLAMVMISTSRFFTWASSWAMTPSSSAGESVFMIPVVAHTVALLRRAAHGEGVGHGVSATAIFGLGRSAWMQRRSIIACRPGRLLGRDLLGAHRGQRELVREEQLQQRQAADDHDHDDRAGAGGEQRADEGHVQQPQQEQRDQHPELEAGVAREDCL